MMKITFPPERVQEVLVNWYETATAEYISYVTVPSSMVPNKQNRSLRMLLRPKDPLRDEEPFSMIIRHTSQSTTVMTDAVDDDDPSFEFEAEMLVAADQLLVYAIDHASHVYIHLYLE